MMTVLRMRPAKRNTTRESAASRYLVGITRRLHTNVLTGLDLKIVEKYPQIFYLQDRRLLLLGEEGRFNSM